MPSIESVPVTLVCSCRIMNCIVPNDELSILVLQFDVCLLVSWANMLLFVVMPLRIIGYWLYIYVCIFSAPPVIPVSDIKGTDSMSYTKQEKSLRCKLAACYRLVDINGWSHSIYNHITVSIQVIIIVHKV